MASRGGRPLVITDPTVLVRHANGRLVLAREGQVIASVPLSGISHVALHGPVTLTGAALARILDAGLDVSILTSTGRFRGMATATQSGNVYLLLAQAEAWRQMEQRVGFARRLVVGKISGQRQLLQRKALDRDSPRCREAAGKLSALVARVGEHGTLDALRGVEGAGSAAYFEVFDELVGADWTFPGRVRRPPTDPVNALLSFGYTLAVGEVGRQLTLGGFDTRIGLLHGLRYGRESLSLDLVEELRAPMVDRFTINLLMRRQIAPTDFATWDNGAVRLSDDGRRRYLELWETMVAGPAPRLNRQPVSPAPDLGDGALRIDRKNGAVDAEDGPSWRFLIEQQVDRLRAFLLHGKPYDPLVGTIAPET